MSKILIDCPLCGGSNLRGFLTARDPHYGIAGEYSLVRCATCSLVFTNPMYSDEELASLYPADYYAYHSSSPVSHWKKLAKRWLGYWQGTKDPHFHSPGRFLDVGCGSGDFVERMREAGWETHGVEISDAAARAGQSRGLSISSGKVEGARFPAESFDYVRASHSLEHMTDPHAALDEMFRILRPGGTLLLAVPNIESLSARIFKQYWWHLCPPVHPFQYSVATLSRLLNHHGFTIAKVVYNSDYVGILGSLQIWANRENRRRSYEGGLFSNKVLRVIAGWMEKVCDLLHYGDMIEITAMKPVTKPQHLGVPSPASESLAKVG